MLPPIGRISHIKDRRNVIKRLPDPYFRMFYKAAAGSSYNLTFSPGSGTDIEMPVVGNGIEFQEISSFVSDVRDASDNKEFKFKFTSNSAGSTDVEFGPMEVLVDMPMNVGCFEQVYKVSKYVIN